MKVRPRLLLFPAGLPQREAFEAARELDVAVVAVDRDPQAPCRYLAEDFHVLDPGDADGLVRFALEYHRHTSLAGVLVVGCDLPVSCAKVAAALGTPGIPVAAAELTINKLRMKQVLKEKEVAVPAFYEVRSAREVEAILRRCGRRMIIKPNDNCGARGVQQLDAGSDCAAAYAAALQNVRQSGVILEEFELGPQISIEALVHKGHIHVTGFADRNYEYIDRFFPFVLENGATLPSALSPSARKEVTDMFCRGIKALGIDNGVAKGDMVHTAHGAKVIEIAGRVSGGKFASMIVPESTGVQLLHAAIQVALGQTPDPIYLSQDRNNGVAVRYFFPPAGVVQSISDVTEARDMLGVLELVMTYKPGDRVPPVRSHPDRGGWVVCRGKDRNTAVTQAQAAVKHVRFNVDTGKTEDTMHQDILGTQAT